MIDFSRLKKNLKKDFTVFPEVKVAILGDTATQFLVQAIRGYGYEVSLNIKVLEADYNQIERQIFDTSSKLYEFQPDFLIVFYSTHKFMKLFYGLSDQAKASFADDRAAKISDIYETVASNMSCRMIYLNHPEIDDAVFGNFSNKVNISFKYQLRKLNFQLMNISQKLKNLFICDLSSLQNQYGEDFAFDAKFYVNSDMVLSLDFVPLVAKHITEIILAVIGKFKKCLITDLDNTLWGGVVGDDGVGNIQIGDLGIGKAFTELQLWIKQLKERGIILGVCSKNTENIAKEPFEKHPDMALRLDDFAIFVANWENKADNLKAIREVLNIGFDSMVFLDDSPFERNMVRTIIPDITVPELPEDPAEYLLFLRKSNLFEAASYTEKDKERTQQYQQETKRSIMKKSFTSEEDFLKSLEMVSIMKPFDSFDTPRVAQLTQRSNQFNLRTIRYTEEDIQRIATSKDYFGISFSLEDRLGSYGLISVIILKKKGDVLFIDTWIMSCRVLKRGMENFVLNQLVSLVKEHHFKKLVGEYIPTRKNAIVKDHYANLGFRQEDRRWILELADYESKACFIKAKRI
jgi:FkbH-like protein